MCARSPESVLTGRETSRDARSAPAAIVASRRCYSSAEDFTSPSNGGYPILETYPSPGARSRGEIAILIRVFPFTHLYVCRSKIILPSRDRCTQRPTYDSICLHLQFLAMYKRVIRRRKDARHLLVSVKKINYFFFHIFNNK